MIKSLMKKFLKRAFFALLALIAVATFVIGIEILGGHPMGLFSGSRPAALGFNDGKFAPPSWKPNCVSSTVASSDAVHYIAPITFSAAPEATWKKLHALIAADKSASVIKQDATYLYAEYKTPTLGFIDDVEFSLDVKGQRIHMRSASRLGVRDLGVNRKRIEALRAQLAK